MPSAQARLPHDGGGDREIAEPRNDDHPVSLEDIDRALDESAGVARGEGAAPLRAWRDGLGRALDVLTYAQGVLTDDVDILRHRLATDAPSSKEIIDDLPGVLAARSSGKPASAPDDPAGGAEADPGLFARADVLLAAHAEMARVDLTSPRDVERVLAILEEQVAALVTRRAAVETRLAEIRAAIVAQYKDGSIPTQTRPG